MTDSLQPGSSAIFLLSSDADREKVRRAFPRHEAELVYTDLSPDEAARLTEFLQQTDSTDRGTLARAPDEPDNSDEPDEPQ